MIAALKTCWRILAQHKPKHDISYRRPDQMPVQAPAATNAQGRGERSQDLEPDGRWS